MNSVIEAHLTYLAWHFPLSWRRFRVVNYRRPYIGGFGLERDYAREQAEDAINEQWNREQQIRDLDNQRHGK